MAAQSRETASCWGIREGFIEEVTLEERDQ